MIVKDSEKLRLLFAQQGIYKQVEMANLLDMSKNSVVRLFKKLPIHKGTARRIARLVNANVDELFEDVVKENSFPKALAGPPMMELVPA